MGAKVDVKSMDGTLCIEAFFLLYQSTAIVAFTTTRLVKKKRMLGYV
jgi:hypothetical protein